MAAPSVPTVTSLITEGLKRGGYPSPSSIELARATDWLEEIKNDIWLLGKRLKPLMAVHTEVLVPGQSRYNFPSGFSSIVDAKILYADDVRDVTGGGAATVTLDTTDETDGEDELEGKWILIYSGTGKNGYSQIISYNESTYVATVSPAWTTQPIATDTYMIVDRFLPLDLRSVVHFDEIEAPHQIGPPNTLYQVGHENHYGYYNLFPVPDEDHYYGILINYYLNLMTLDLAGTRMSTLYQRWRNLWIQGVRARQLEDDNDSRASMEMARYYGMVKDIVNLETYGRNIKPHYTGIKA